MASFRKKNLEREEDQKKLAVECRICIGWIEGEVQLHESQHIVFVQLTSKNTNRRKKTFNKQLLQDTFLINFSFNFSNVPFKLYSVFRL